LDQRTPLLRTPKVAILVAIKGAGETTPRFLEALCRQRYSVYRLIFAVESPADPIFPLVTRLQEELEGKIEVTLAVAGPSTERAQKVHNLLAALQALRDDDQIVVFADADIVPDAAWLSELVQPVANRLAAASSGYRWQLPTDTRWPSLIVAAADMSIATAARSARWNLCWGGSVAVDREALNRLDLPRVWHRAASDDLTLTSALRAQGLIIHAAPRVLVPSPVGHSWTSLFTFAHRQYLLVRAYAPGHWLLTGWSLCLPTLAAAIAVGAALTGHWRTLYFLLASIALLQVRLLIRRSIADILLPPCSVSRARTTIAFAQWTWPVIHLVHLAAFLTSLQGQRFTWAGISYRLKGRTVTVDRQAGDVRN
jgi:cellulose synthase/poly-beta-1,6-N-acetylglucosamine synthase-like glycosyltransferase